MPSKQAFRTATLKAMSKTSKEKRAFKHSSESSDSDESVNDNHTSLENLSKLPSLSDEEYAFFHLIRDGDMNGLKDFMSSAEFSKINVNKTDRFGYSALHYAVKRQDEEMVEILMSQKDILIYDAIFYAIEEENVPITKRLLKQVDENKPATVTSTTGIVFTTESSANIPLSVRSSPEQATSKRSFQDLEYFDSDFPPYMTAFLKSAQMGNSELMEIFYSRGEHLETAEEHHNCGCRCRLCSRHDKSLSCAEEKKSLFEALTNPNYICFLSGKLKLFDPVNYAIEKVSKCRELIDKEHEFDDNYLEYMKRLEEFIKDFMYLCRSTEEADIFMSIEDSPSKKTPRMKYPRLWKLVGLKQIDVIGHPNSQCIVNKLWTTSAWVDWNSYGLARQLVEVIARIILLPLIALFLIFGSKSKFGRKLASPVSRYLNWIASYTIFLAILLAQVLLPQRCNNEPKRIPYTIEDGKCDERGAPNIGTEWPLVLYVFGFLLSLLKRSSIEWFWSSNWAWYELINQCLFMGTFICWLVAWAQNNPRQARIQWKKDYPEVLAESFLSVAVIMAFCRLFRLIQLNKTVGPLQIALGRIVHSFFSTVCVYSLVIFAFGLGLMAIYVPYNGLKGFDKDGNEKDQASPFGTAKGSFEELFWSFYGLSGSDKPDIINFKYINNGTDIRTTNPWVSEKAGKFLFGSYHILGVLMMFNMLVAYFTGHADEVLNNSDGEWKFARTEVYMNFIKDSVLPPPFNLIPTVRGLARLCQYLQAFCIPSEEKGEATCTLRQCCVYIEHRDKDDDLHKRRAYRRLVLQLTHRYKMFIVDKGNHQPATSDDVKEIEEELTELKSQVESKLRELEDQLLPTGKGVDSSGNTKTAVRGVSSEELDILQNTRPPVSQGSRKSSVVVTFSTRAKRLISRVQSSKKTSAQQLSSLRKLSAPSILVSKQQSSVPTPPPVPSSPKWVNSKQSVTPPIPPPPTSRRSLEVTVIQPSPSQTKSENNRFSV